MLKKWLLLLLETDPDVIIGYNIINFDLPYLYERAVVSRWAVTSREQSIVCLGHSGGHPGWQGPGHSPSRPGHSPSYLVPLLVCVLVHTVPCLCPVFTCCVWLHACACGRR